MRATILPPKKTAIGITQLSKIQLGLPRLLRWSFSANALLAVLTLASLLLVACGGDSTAPAPTPDMTGAWSGTYSSAVITFSVNLEISTQQEESFAGAWKWSTSDIWPTDSPVTGYTYPSNDNRTLVDLSLTSGGNIECCTLILGCYVFPLEAIDVFGYLENGKITDLSAGYRYGCGATVYGEMSITRLATEVVN